MTTSPPFNQNQTQLTLFAAASPAKTSAPLANRQASTKALGLGSSTNSSESFAWYDHSSSSWKTSQRSLLMDWTPFSQSWPRQGLMLNGHVFQRRLWVPVTNAIAGGSLPTPTAALGASGGSNCSGVRRPENLASAVKTKLAVPQVYQGQARKRMLPTPTTNDSKNSTLPPSQANRDGLPGAMLRDDSIPTGEATYLNPSFVEEMMGFPVGWTA
jgi:hypothetical protein